MLGLLGDKKKAISTILGEQPKMEEKKVSDGLEADFSSAYGQLSSDVIAAVKADDARGLASALKSLVQAIVREEEYQEDMQEEMGD